ncbi:hypothetical protein C437_15376 [Haloarcula vallismortis ATCC 29715]|uniref:Uncharacterized protein n=1 Tax=Haloarcula vallismortis ATCC 29715 TaxID=662477 RepID=M0J0D3_HALVA|nr:hypothetical protein [Haloarcula vallismortis]EMA01813.1 hypothetical protein C437_15376 [Haloarcula vallismortis ATCC 29715]
MSKRQTVIALGMLVLVAASPLAGIAAAANFNSSVAQNPEVEVDVTKSTHEMGWSAEQYEADNGELKSMNARLNSSVENPYSYALDGVNETDYGAFPHAKSDTSALEAVEWTKDMSGSAGTGTIADTSPEPGVDAVSLSTSSQASGDVAKFTMGNFSVTSDAEKRMLQVGMNINTLESGATVEVRAVDADGDYVSATANPSQTGGEEQIASATGDGYMFQRQVGKMAVSGSGDGTMGEIQKTVVVVSDANADVDIYALNADKFGKWDFGTQRIDTDGDGELDDSETVYEVNESNAGTISVTGLDTLGSTFDDARLNDVTVPMLFEASELESEDTLFEFSAAEGYPSFDSRVDAYYRLQLPESYDLSYSNAELKDTVEMPDTRYQTVEYAEGTGDTEMTNISSWTDKTGSYGTQGANVSVDSTVSVGTNMVIHYDYVITSDEKQELQSDTTDSKGGGVLGGGSGGIVDTIVSLPGAIIGGLLSFVTGRKIGVF